jgi:VWFA-related protein
MLNRTRTALALLVAITAGTIPASAARRVTSEQLQQTLAASLAAHRLDDAIAQQLAGYELSARLSPSALSQLLATASGPKTRQALRVMADASAFLDPPVAEIPPKPAPDLATQKVILTQAIRYVARTLPSLPDFLATRRTEHFDDSPQWQDAGGWRNRGEFNFKGTSETPISFRDGRETDDPLLQQASLPTPTKAVHSKSAKAKPPAPDAQADQYLASWGEFGPILGVILVDAAKGKVTWARWEEENGKTLAVFRFTVDRAVSHYMVQSKENTPAEPIGTNYGSRGGQGISQGEIRSGDARQRRQPAAYHGTLAVDLDNGTILRIVIQADLEPNDSLKRAEIVVEYGSVTIGEGTYICPTHSVTESLSQVNFQQSPIGPLVRIDEIHLNDVAYVDYRRFGSEAKIVAPPPPPSEQPAATEPAPSAQVADSPNPPAVSAPEPNPPTPVTPVAETASAPPAPAAANVAPTEAEEEVLIRSVNGLPGLPESAPNTGDSGSGTFTLKVTTRLVDVSLVASDRHGKPISDLKQDEIEIYDNGHKQQVRTFHHGVANPPQPDAPQPTQQDTFTNSAPAQVEDAPDTLILLMDESHLAYLDLNRARAEVLRFLKSSRRNTRVALYAIGEHGFHVLQDVTSDHALVEQKLAAWKPTSAAVSQAQALETRNRQQIDTVRNASDLDSVNGNQNSAPDYITSVDPQLRLLGNNPLSAALGSMISLARHFAPVPGHKSIAWIAGDSVLADWSDQAVGMDKGDKLLEGAIQHTREALNEAHMALYAIDASALNASGPDASIENQNVMLNPTATAMSAPGNQAPTRNTTAGRQTAEMQQNLHAIQGPVRLLAESTGGRAINKGSDLKATLDTIDQDSAALYEIGFDPDTPADGKLHTLLLKIPGRKGVTLRYRSGYLYNEEVTNTKQRFQQAIWSPQDLTAIQLTAEALSASDAPSGKRTVKLRITLPGLSLEKKDDRWTDNLYIFIAQRDDAAQKAAVSGDTLRLSLKQATYASGMPAGVPYQHAVDVESKFGSIRVLVVDGNSGKIGSVTLPSSAFHD